MQVSPSKPTLFFLLFLSLHFLASAQLQNANWYFGHQAGLNFNDGSLPPTILTNNAMFANGSSVSVSDNSGNLLFYTNGINVWNNTHQLMTNGLSLNGNTEINQSVIIVPDPNNANAYYIITNSGDVMGQSGLYYSLVDMSLDSGLGAVDATKKNILLIENNCKNLTTILNPNDNTYWVIAFGKDNVSQKNGTFFSFKVDTLGINLVNQATFAFTLNEGLENTDGQLKIAPDGQSLALSYNTVGEGRNGEFAEAQSLFLFNFDNSTGLVSQLNDTISIDDNLYSYGIEFSPDSNLLYVTTTNEFNLGNSVGRIHQIQYKDAMSTPQLIYDSTQPIYGLQTAIDGKIYAVNSSGTLGVINTPNIVGNGANYVSIAIDLAPAIAVKELPQSVPDIIINEQTKKAKKPIIMGNPFKDELKFKFKFIQTYTIEFYNSLGGLSKRIIYDDMRNRKPYAVDTSDLQPDTYYLIIRDEQSQIWYETVLKID
ncbi:MAG: hypothetical protein QNJ57_04855 [Flavobacteriaceae bacterium]|nr:hypothetical protein [Flavobacteriaceae bacterium]